MFFTSKSSWRVPLLRTQRRVIPSGELDGSVGVRSAAARVLPVEDRVMTGRRAVDESPDIHEEDPTWRALNVMSPRW